MIIFVERLQMKEEDYFYVKAEYLLLRFGNNKRN